MKTKYMGLLPVCVLILMVLYACKKENEDNIDDGFVCGESVVIDFDNNVYKTVLIGTQCWMSENLKTTHYRNGTPIAYPSNDNTAWQNNSNGAYAWNFNDVAWKEIYGALYNWFAIENSHGLCPEGWQVPTDNQWLQLTEFVVKQGSINQMYETNGAGNSLKSCRQFMSPLEGECNTSGHPRWNQSHTYGFDLFGFSALPGGVRGSNEFLGTGDLGFWWSSSRYSVSNAWHFRLGSQYGHIDRSTSDKVMGFSVRCIKK